MSETKTRAFVKREVKEEICKLLKAGIPTLKGRVAISRSIPTDAQNLPTVLVYTTGENISRFDEAPKNYQRVLNVQIEIIAAGNDDSHLDFILEDIGNKIENVMEHDETLGGRVNKLELSGSAYQYEPDAQSPIGALVLSYNIEYFTDAQFLEDSTLEQFQGADAQWQVGHHADSSDEVIDATDTIDMET